MNDDGFKVGSRVVRVGKHTFSGYDYKDRECQVGSTGRVDEVFKTYVYVKWDDGRSSCIDKDGLALEAEEPQRKVPDASTWLPGDKLKPKTDKGYTFGGGPLHINHDQEFKVAFPSGNKISTQTGFAVDRDSVINVSALERAMKDAPQRKTQTMVSMPKDEHDAMKKELQELRALKDEHAQNQELLRQARAERDAVVGTLAEMKRRGFDKMLEEAS